MNFPFYIAKRYLFAKKSHNIINIISGISVAGVTLGTFALIVVLSVFNGFEDLVKSLFNTFDADIEITAKEGKSFIRTTIPESEIRNLPGVISYSEVIEENALIKYKSEQFIVSLKGVSEDYLFQNPLDSMIVDGDFILQDGNRDFALLGYLVAYRLGINLNDFSTPINVYVPRRTKKSFSGMESSFNSVPVFPGAVFAIQQDIDSKFMVIPFDAARALLEYEEEVSAIEIRLEPEVDADKVMNRIEEIIDKGKFNIKDRYQQQELLYKIMGSEKWAIFFILTFILIIATFNVIGSLSMLILDKRKDIGVLYSLGASAKLIKKIFLFEGWLISIGGALIGLILGYLICLLQIKYQIISLGSDAGAFIIPYYPVKIQLFDFFGVFITVMLIGFLSAWYPVRQISRKYLNQRISDFTKTQ